MLTKLNICTCNNNDCDWVFIIGSYENHIPIRCQKCRSKDILIKEHVTFIFDELHSDALSNVYLIETINDKCVRLQNDINPCLNIIASFKNLLK